MFFKKKHTLIDNDSITQAYWYLAKTYDLFCKRTGHPNNYIDPKQYALAGISTINIVATLAGRNGFESLTNNDIYCHNISVRVDFIAKNNMVNFESAKQFLDQSKKWYQEELKRHENSNTNPNV